MLMWDLECNIDYKMSNNILQKVAFNHINNPIINFLIYKVAEETNIMKKKNDTRWQNERGKGTYKRKKKLMGEFMYKQ